MVLVDTSVWISHFQRSNTGFVLLLNNGNVLCHPLIIVELACGNLKNRNKILSLMKSLPSAIQAENEEILQFIDNYFLMGKGLGYVDMHLLASSLLSNVPIWTLDKRLKKISLEMGLAYL